MIMEKTEAVYQQPKNLYIETEVDKRLDKTFGRGTLSKAIMLATILIIGFNIHFILKEDGRLGGADHQSL